jgi:hypothetical protein
MNLRKTEVSAIRLVLIILMMTGLCGMAETRKMILVEKGTSLAPIIVAADAPLSTMQAAGELASYIEKISGARPPLVVGEPNPMPHHAIWVGYQPAMVGLFPGVRFEFQHPEEILMACNKCHLVIAGRDRMDGTNQVESGTANAVYVFLEKYLDVRWLWPGPLGEDVIRKDSIALPSFEYRFHPPLRMRKIHRPQLGADVDRELDAWFRYQRLELTSLKLDAGHSFMDWWDKYHELHPDWFALSDDKTRTPEKWGNKPNPQAVKLCVSNPEVAAQWLKNAEELLLKDPSRIMIGATPNDGGGFCTCANCRAWDNPNGPPMWSYVALTDRYVKFWNILARGLKERFPDRDVCVGAYAYSVYRTPPVSESMEKNIAIAQVGQFPLTTEDERQTQKKEWQQWAEKTGMMWYRPNLWYWCGGIWGMPEVAMKKTIEDFRFLAENHCIGLEVDGYRGYWATQGPEYYVMAKVTYDPLHDGQALLKDYYRRGFGPAAKTIEKYWNLMEEAQEAVLQSPNFRLGNGNRYGLPAVFQQVYTERFLDRADQLLQQASAEATEGPEVYRKRVEFVQYGLDYTRLMMRSIALMTLARESHGKDVQAVRKAVENWAAIEQLVKQAGPIGLNHYKNIIQWVTGEGYMGGMNDYFGPPSEAMRKEGYSGPAMQHDVLGIE